MYIAHQCTKCFKSDILFDNFTCHYCEHTENEQDFWPAYQSERYLHELECEIDSRYPIKDIDIIDSVIDLAVGYHVLGRFDSRDYCINSIMNDIVKLNEQWDICYCNFEQVNQKIKSFKNITTDENSKKYAENLNSLTVFFKDFNQKIILVSNQE